MKKFLSSIVDQLKDYSKKLDKKAILINKPWALVDSDLEIQKLIFKKNHELIMSKNGKVEIGRWEYLPEARSLLIDRGKDKILCNEGFLDDSVIILKRDGTKDDFFVLANENDLPDLDAYTYLKKLRYRNLSIYPVKLDNSLVLEIINIIGEFEQNYLIGKQVTIDCEPVEDGVYKEKDDVRKYIIEDSQIRDIVFVMSYKTKDGCELLVEQDQFGKYAVGDKVWINNEIAPDGDYKVKWGKNIIVRNGRIYKRKLF